MHGIFKRDYWEQGHGIDLWSIPHFLFGILVAMLSPLFNFSFVTTFSVMIILALLWEVYEKIVSIEETILNILFDVVLPIVSFAITANVLIGNSFRYADLVLFTIIVFLLYMAMNLFGWFAHLKRKHAQEG